MARGFKRMRARFAGVCAGCGAEVRVGASIDYGGPGKVFHAGCAPTGNARADAEYMKGVAEANEFITNRKVCGEAYAEQVEMERELRTMGEY